MNKLSVWQRQLGLRSRSFVHSQAHVRILICELGFLKDHTSAILREQGDARLLAMAGVRLEVLELTGAPKASAHPRLMATHRFVRADVVPALWHSHGCE